MKQFFTLALLCALAAGAHAQSAPSWTWAASLSTAATPIATSVATDAAGDTYVAGSFTQPITLAAGTVLTSTSGSDGFVAKYGPTGTLLWHRQLTGLFNDLFQQVVTDAAGNVTLVGSASDGSQLGSAALSSTTFGPVLVLTQLDAQGQVLYLREVGSGTLLACSDLALDAAGNCYVSGYFSLDAHFGSLALSTPSTNTSITVDQFLVKFSPQGTPLWARQGGRTQPVTAAANKFFFSSLSVDRGGNAYLTWTCNADAAGFGSLAMPAGYGDFDLVVVKYDAQGTPQWVRRAGSAGLDAASHTALDASGRLVVPGFVTGASTFGGQALAPTGPTAGYVWVLEPTAGATAWVRALNSTEAAAYRGVAADAAGNIYAVGNLRGRGTLGTKALTSAGGTDGLVVNYAADGTVRWVQQTSGAGDENPLVIALDGTNRLAVAGYLSGAGQFGSVALVGQNNAVGSLFVAHLGPAVVTATRAAQAAAPLALYPNPAAGEATVALPALPAGTQLTLTDALGRVDRRRPAGAGLPLAGLAPGIYVVQAIAPDGQQWASRLVVE